MMMELFRLFIGSLLNKARTAGLIGLGAIAILVAILFANNGDVNTQDVADFLSNYGLTVVAPIASLLFASAAFGDMQEDRTLVYLWMKPVARWKPVLAAFGASLTIVLPLTVIPLIGAALIADSSTAGGIAAAAIVAVIVYCSVFIALGLLTKRPLLWGLAYILVWEGFIAGAGDVASNIAMRSYTRSILAQITDTTLGQADSSLTTAYLVPIIVAVVTTTFSVWRFKTIDVD